MENSFLNMAHVYGRRADHHSKHRRFDEAIENHRKAASYIEEALKIAPQSAVVIESLQLQRKYHQKQVEFVRHRKQQYERYMKALEYQRKRNPEFLAKQLEKMDKYSELQVAIYQNLDETDSLLETMAQNSNEHRMPAVEDLITLNHSLHVLVHRMTQNIDEYVTENETLKETLNLYRNDAGDKTAANRRLDREHNVRIASVETDRDVMEVNDYHQKGLPALAPLELPTFDLPEFEGN